MEDADVQVEKSPNGRENMPDIISPQGYIVLVWAVLLDLIGVLIFILEFFGIGIPISWIFDVIGILTIGIWSWRKTGDLLVTKRVARFLKRPGLAFLGEVIPFIGVLPFWSLYVFIDLKKGFEGYGEIQIDEYENESELEEMEKGAAG